MIDHEITRRLELANLWLGGIDRELIQPSIEEIECKVKTLEDRIDELTPAGIEKRDHLAAIVESLELLKKGFRQSGSNVNAILNNLED